MILQDKVVVRVRVGKLKRKGLKMSLTVLGAVVAVNGIATMFTCFLQFNVYGKRLRREPHKKTAEKGPPRTELNNASLPIERKA